MTVLPTEPLLARQDLRALHAVLDRSAAWLARGRIHELYIAVSAGITLYSYLTYPQPTPRARYRPADIGPRSRAVGQRRLDCRASRISTTGTRSPHRTQAGRAMQ